MKILVPFKRVPDYASGPALVSAEQGQWIVNPFDEIAIEEALRIRERGEAEEVVAVTIAGPAADDQARSAFGMGVDRVLRVDHADPLDSSAVARVLAAVVQREQPRLVVMGKQAVDGDAAQAGQMLAGLLGWPQVTFISKLELIDGAARVRCTRETDRGLEVVAARLPAVVTTDLRLNEPRYVALTALMKARRRPIEVLSLADLGVSPRNRTTVHGVAPAPQRSGCVRVESVEDLVNRLRTVDKVL